jgi:hypothetical protein
VCMPGFLLPVAVSVFFPGENEKNIL